MKKSNKTLDKEESITEINIDNFETIYVDKIVNVGIGFNVTRFTLTQEVADGTSRAFANLVMPTSRVFEFISFMTEHITNNPVLKNNLTTAIDDFKEKIATNNDKVLK